MHFLLFLLIGLIAGALAKAITPGAAKEPAGWFLTMLLGVVGAYVGGFVGGLFGIGASNTVGSILMATFGAVLVIGLMRAFSRNSSGSYR